jgi:hypothetical protein
MAQRRHGQKRIGQLRTALRRADRDDVRSAAAALTATRGLAAAS